jgi:hypothetical protein
MTRLFLAATATAVPLAVGTNWAFAQCGQSGYEPTPAPDPYIYTCEYAFGAPCRWAYIGGWARPDLFLNGLAYQGASVWDSLLQFSPDLSETETYWNIVFEDGDAGVDACNNPSTAYTVPSLGPPDLYCMDFQERYFKQITYVHTIFDETEISQLGGDPWTSTDIRTWTLRHEMGHALGLNHWYAGYYDLMRPYYDWVADPANGGLTLQNDADHLDWLYQDYNMNFGSCSW